VRVLGVFVRGGMWYVRRCVCAGVCVCVVCVFVQRLLCEFLCLLFLFFSPACVFVCVCLYSFSLSLFLFSVFSLSLSHVFLQVSIQLNLFRSFFLISIPCSSSTSSHFFPLPKNCVLKKKKGERSRNGLEPFHSN
jgi:hypothetical protein